MIPKLQAIVLAAGSSSRFKTGRTKLLEKICGQELILYPVKLLEAMNIPPTLVVGHQKEEIKTTIAQNCSDSIIYATQEEPRGTGDALRCTKHLWYKEHILIMNGDMPLVNQTTIELLYKKHIDSNASLSFVTAYNADPSLNGYGRVIQTADQIQIVEARDLQQTQLEQEYCYINAGIYIATRSFLENHIETIEPKNNAKEFYLTDLVKIASSLHHTITTVSAPFDQIRGINTFQELWAAEQIKRAELINYWMDHGVRFSTPHSVHLDLDVSIGSGTFIASGVHLVRGTRIGKNCRIGEFSSLEDATIDDYAQIQAHTLITQSHIGKRAIIGPFAHVHNNSSIMDEAVIGNFVEVKRSTIGIHSKAKHLTYLGDAIVGNQASIGAGTITCNYNGLTKHTTTIGDRAFVGSNNTLVAPVTIEQNAFTAAGSVITDDVPEDALAISRSRQVNKKNYAPKLRNPLGLESQAFLAAIKAESDSSVEES